MRKKGGRGVAEENGGHTVRIDHAFFFFPPPPPFRFFLLRFPFTANRFDAILDAVPALPAVDNDAADGRTARTAKAAKRVRYTVTIATRIDVNDSNDRAFCPRPPRSFASSGTGAGAAAASWMAFAPAAAMRSCTPSRSTLRSATNLDT